MTLRTMRANIDTSRLPYRLVDQLHKYDENRVNLGLDIADNLFTTSDWRDGDMFRLRIGLKRLTVRGVCRIAKKCANLDAQYVKTHTGDLCTLQGLFYWNGCDETVTRLLLAAWRKGHDRQSSVKGSQDKR